MLNRLETVFRSLNDHDVRYLVIGGIAAILHGVPRATFDLDILIERTQENAEALLSALLAAGLGTAALTSAEEVYENDVTIFKDRVRVDVQTHTPGIVFLDAWQRRQEMSFQGTTIPLLSKDDLVRSKKAALCDSGLPRRSSVWRRRRWWSTDNGPPKVTSHAHRER